MNYIKKCNIYDEQKLNSLRDYFIPNIDSFLNYKKTNLVKHIENVNQLEIYPLLSDYIKKEDIFLFTWIHVKPNSKISVHSDTGDWVWSLVIPIHNFLNTSVEIYTSSENPIYTQSPEVSYFKYNENTLSLLDFLPITSPFFLNTTAPHTIRNNNSDFSFYVSIRLNKNFMIHLDE
jgi:hypothetical protein